MSASPPLRLAVPRCAVRPWARPDRESLLAHANDRRVWRNLADVLPHPYTAADADAWFTSPEKQDPLTHFAIEVDGQAVGGIGLTLCPGAPSRTAS